MRRLLLAAVLLAVTAPPASAAHCRPRHGEQALARSTEATVFAKLLGSRQDLVGCSRRTGRRRDIDALPRDGYNALIGLRLAGTRVAYVTAGERGATLIADDAVHGGRHHTLPDVWPFTLRGPSRVLSWAVDAEGDVASIMRGDAPAGVTVLVVWRRGLGTRLVDARATLTGVRLRGGTLTWRRNGVPRTLDLTGIPRSACRPGSGTGTGTGTPAFDMVGYDDVCLRSTGTTERLSYKSALLDANGPYIVYNWVVHVHRGVGRIDLTTGDSIMLNTTPLDPESYGYVSDAVVDDHGSMAWVVKGQLWVRDADGTRAVPGAGTGPLLRDGSTITWSGGGPSVTLNP